MKNRIYRRLKQFLIMLSISMTLISGPVAGNEISKMLKCMDERNELLKEINEVENEENDGDNLEHNNSN